MYSSQAPVRDLYDAICANEHDCFATTLMPWLARHRDERDWLAAVGAADQLRWQPSDEDLCRLYAFSRVNDLVLLGFQPVPRPGAGRGPSLSPDQYGEFLTTLGMRIVERSLFHPFYHEVVAVLPSDDPDAPVELMQTLWPCSMIGGLVFSRAGVVVRAGVRQMVPSIAESSTLYWAHRRTRRPVLDLSRGWGSNSQWRTRFRRDFLMASAYRFNADSKWEVGQADIDNDAQVGQRELSVDERIELLVHRCFVRTALPHDDCWPWDHGLTVPVADTAGW